MKVHFVGSLGFADAATVFRKVTEILGTRLTSIPDGESGVRSGVRSGWVRWQSEHLARNPPSRRPCCTSLRSFRRKFPSAASALERNVPTRIVLGLIHDGDGFEGTQRRMMTARRHFSDFDIGTECGFGRRNPATTEALLTLHRDLCDRA